MISTELSGLDTICEPMRQLVRELAELVQELGGPRVESLTIFGALAANSFNAKRHSVRSVLVLDQIDLDFLQRFAQQGRRLGKSGFAAPLIMTPGYIKASLDTFPLELIEIHQCHVTVFGEDHFADLSLEDRHVRLQCERELKVILINLRQGLLAAAGRKNVLEMIEADLSENLLRTMRGMLWLKGSKSAEPALTVVGQVEKLTSRELPGVRTALDLDSKHGWEEFQSLYKDVETLGNVVDAW